MIKPGILINGRTYYPSGDMWLFAFAIAGCKWAIEALNAKYSQELLAYMHEMRHYPNVPPFFELEISDTPQSSSI